ERRPLAQDGQPGQPGLERLQGHPLEQRVVTAQLDAPLLIVVGDVLGRAAAPGAAHPPIRPGAGAVHYGLPGRPRTDGSSAAAAAVPVGAASGGSPTSPARTPPSPASRSSSPAA